MESREEGGSIDNRCPWLYAHYQITGHKVPIGGIKPRPLLLSAAGLIKIKSSAPPPGANVVNPPPSGSRHARAHPRCAAVSSVARPPPLSHSVAGRAPRRTHHQRGLSAAALTTCQTCASSPPSADLPWTFRVLWRRSLRPGSPPTPSLLIPPLTVLRCSLQTLYNLG